MANTYKTLFQNAPGAASLTDAYTVPGSTSTIISTINICNRSATPTSFRLSLAQAGTTDTTKQYISYDEPIGGNQSINKTIGATLATTDVVRVYATLATVSFSGFGVEIT